MDLAKLYYNALSIPDLYFEEGETVNCPEEFEFKMNIEEVEAFKELKERVRKCEQENKRLRSLIAMLIDQGRV